MAIDREIAVVGAGSFGTAIAAALARSGHPVLLHCRSSEQAAALNDLRQNHRYFPGHVLGDGIRATSDAGEALAARILFLAIPANCVGEYVARLTEIHRPEQIVVNLIKGFHPEHFTFAGLFAAELPALSYVALKGPTFAKPMFLGELSGLTCGSAKPDVRREVGALFAGSNVDIDFSESAEAVDTVSGIKNVYAIALGMAAALGLSENTSFLLVSRIVREIFCIVAELGHDQRIMLTHSGLGDLLLTGFCDTSRNRTLGFMVGRGIPIDTSRSGFLTEGARAISVLHRHVGRETTPLLNMLHEILQNGRAPLAILEVLAAGSGERTSSAG